MKKLFFSCWLFTSFMSLARPVVMRGYYHNTVWRIGFNVNDTIANLEDAWIGSLNGRGERRYVPYISYRLFFDRFVEEFCLDFECKEEVVSLVLGILSVCPRLPLVRARGEQPSFGQLTFNKKWIRNLFSMHSTAMLVEAFKVYLHFIANSVEQDSLALFWRDYILSCIACESKEANFDVSPYYSFLLLHGKNLLFELVENKRWAMRPLGYAKISSDGATIAVKSFGSQVLLWDTLTGTLKGIVR